MGASDDYQANAPRGLLAEATAYKPFSNGTEGEAWMGVWCEFCVHDHAITHGDDAQVDGEGCPIMRDVMWQDREEWRWPEAWLPEPHGEHALPSRMICHQFEPCHQGRCDGDPHAETREAIAAEVTAWWKEHAHG